MEHRHRSADIGRRFRSRQRTARYHSTVTESTTESTRVAVDVPRLSADCRPDRVTGSVGRPLAASGRNKIAQHTEKSIRPIAIDAVTRVGETLHPDQIRPHRRCNLLHIFDRRDRIIIPRHDQSWTFNSIQFAQQIEPPQLGFKEHQPQGCQSVSEPARLLPQVGDPYSSIFEVV